MTTIPETLATLAAARVRELCRLAQPRRIPLPSSSHACGVQRILVLTRAACELATLCEQQAREIALLEAQAARRFGPMPTFAELEQRWMDQEDGFATMQADSAEHQHFPAVLTG